MRSHLNPRVAALGAALALAATPAAALGHGNPHHSGHPAQAKSYGYYCRGESKKHVAGQKGTPFSRCVTAMAKAARGERPRKACKGESKKHVAGQKGTPFSRCVVAAAHLKRDQSGD